MVRVSKTVFGAVALSWLAVMGASTFAQTPAPPKAVPAEARKMKAAVASSPAANEAGTQLYAK